ncbi:ethanolamine permease [Swaminathania salitolerans]|uniref:Ethanolamine permease n=1 Tax=Swaminathania salitolerans TaxID=182838 RepID=A0A511BNA0_9PROT|nr:ethanolamine permease [Swaminathania salitolerans]GBQ13817.1 amino acid transporter [Swaminathania salitolerans LMG 21291]GEL01725.1 ethanolamine permease [Swaminathania salitolerans]
MTTEAPKLEKKLGAFHLWGIAVGLVISGEYFGWSYGWATAGTLGFLGATCLVAAMYTAFIFSFTELTCAIPHAGGPFAYASRALGRTGGAITGLATLVEFIFAPPAIALAIGAYMNVQFPSLPPKLAACGAYLLFMTLNIAGVHIAASFELVITIAAIVELLVFMAVVAPSFSWAHFTAMGWGHAPHFGWEAMGGLFAAIPFAIWFFLAIEGVAMAAEEARNPRRSIPIAYLAGVLTLVALAFGVMIFAGGSGDWTQLANLNDPLPQAMKRVVGPHSPWLSMLVWLGLFGLVASLHGIIMGYARQIYALARASILPAWLGTLHPRFHTPHRATLAGGVIGIVAIFADDIVSIHGQPLTATLVTLSVFGALTMYCASMISLFRLRRIAPELERSYRAPLYPFLPGFALVGALICLSAVIYYNFVLFLYYVTFILLAYLFLAGIKKTATETVKER